MRHGKKFNHLSRKAAHRDAMLSNMASSLIKHKRITTTVAKAKALRKYVEPLITKAKDNTTHSRRMVFSYLQDKDSVTELFSTVADKAANRPGGYTRILKMGSRLGDNADMCIMELVDFNELLLQEAKPKKSRRSRRGGKGKGSKSQEAQVAETKAESAETDVQGAEVKEKEEKSVQSDTKTEKQEEKAEDTTTETKAEAKEEKEEKAEKKGEEAAEKEEKKEDKEDKKKD